MARYSHYAIGASLAATWQATIDMLPSAASSLLQLPLMACSRPPSSLPVQSQCRASTAGGILLKHDPGNHAKFCAGFPETQQAEPEVALAALRDFSLLQPAKEVPFESEGQLHRVVALITRERQSPEEQTAALLSALAAVQCCQRRGFPRCALLANPGMPYARTFGRWWVSPMNAGSRNQQRR